MKILIDMDGVLVNFIDPFLKRLKVAMPDPWPDGQYDPKILFGLTEEQCWGGITDLWWYSLQKTLEADQIIQHCLSHTSNVYIVSKPHIWSGGTGKLKWIQDFYPGLTHSYIFTACRELLANDDTILIDDQSNNIDLFNHNSGRGILMPRHWNRNKHNEHPSGQWILQAIDNCVEAMNNGITEIIDKSWKV